MFYNVTKLARIGDRQRSHHIIKLLFWVPMILNILRIWHVYGLGHFLYVSS
ncbi:hypothetical protein F383_01395 [Gossypium arboreum]|uniref:Uncharacterized protein n=1 Tax=Gossypium arboreum TaxID=29729 RepID=A0A0B0PX97_GOSAR|nr:hypothetical protein F383_01395 [Gossypium arboreum]